MKKKLLKLIEKTDQQIYNLNDLLMKLEDKDIIELNKIHAILRFLKQFKSDLTIVINN